MCRMLLIKRFQLWPRMQAELLCRADHIPRLLPAPDNFQALGSRHPCAQRGCITVIAKGYTDPRHIGQKLPQFRRLRQAPAQSNCMNGMNIADISFYSNEFWSDEEVQALLLNNPYKEREV